MKKLNMNRLIKYMLSFVCLFFPVVNAKYLLYYVEDQCVLGTETVTYELDSLSPIVLRPKEGFPYSSGKHCTIVLKPPDGLGVVLAVRKIDFIESPFDFLNQDYLEVYHNESIAPDTLKYFKFDLKEKTSYYSNGPMKLDYHTGRRLNNKVYFEVGFEIVITPFSKGIKNCYGKFHCNNNKCIDNMLTCDGHNNCGDRSDEWRSICDSKFPLLPNLREEYVDIISIISLVFLIIFGYLIFHIIKKKLAQRMMSEEVETPTPNYTVPYKNIASDSNYGSAFDFQSVQSTPPPPYRP